MKPFLTNLKVIEIINNITVIEVKYACDPHIEGIELMGRGDNLSWKIGDGIELVLEDQVGEFAYFTGIIDLKDHAEFRARGYIGNDEYWEENTHEIIRNNNGSIEFISEVKDEVEIQLYPSLNFSPLKSEIENAIKQIPEKEPYLFQLLIYVALWAIPIMIKPLENPNIDYIPRVIISLKEQSRRMKSYIVDEITRPVYLALFDIYISVKTYHEDDQRILKGSWEKKGYNIIFGELIEKIKSLDFNKIGTNEDWEKKYAELLKYVG